MREHVDQAAVVAATQALVRVDTRNPPGDEARIVATCRELLAHLDARIEVVEPAAGRASVIAVLPPTGKPVLVVNGHLDVVPISAGDWTVDPFGAEVADGRVWGRGTADMKGGIAAALEAVDALARSGREPVWDLVFHLVADEERGGRWGTQVLVEQGFCDGVAACLVPEPTDLEVCVAERGLLVAHLTTLGRPAHGSAPRQGISAVETAAKAVLALHAAEFEGEDHPLLGHPTANIGQIQGGSGHNTVAESCRVTVDRRVLPGATLESTLAEVEAKVQAVGDPDMRYDVEVEVFGEASELDADHPYAALVRRCIAEATGRQPGVIGMPFTTDARFVRNGAGVPAVVCGPGGIAQAHVHDEWVAVDRLVDAAAAFATLYATPLPPA
jgi:acetylornithine deacetylase/succinyl-diaminopimelate desuccinylase family protein